jgi:hypothetical protein
MTKNSFALESTDLFARSADRFVCAVNGLYLELFVDRLYETLEFVG